MLTNSHAGPVGEVAFIALGSNLGERERHLAAARAALAGLPGTTFIAESEIEETAPLGPPGQGPYLNQMVAIRTSLTPLALLDELLGIERAEGRVRAERWGPRTLDLDIVRFGDQEIRDPRLVVPHPEISHRSFWQHEMGELVALLGADSARTP